MKDGVYIRRWTTSTGKQRERVYVVRAGKAMSLVRGCDWDKLSEWHGRTGEWVWLRELGVGHASGAVAL